MTDQNAALAVTPLDAAVPSAAQATLPPDDLRALLDHLPIGLIHFRPDGEILLHNPMAAQLLHPVIGQAGLHNMFAALATCCPDLAATIAAFAPLRGPVIEQHRIDSQAGTQRVTLSLGVTRLGADAYMAVIRDIGRLAGMLGFAFAAADLLVEIDSQTIIRWTGGALRVKLPYNPKNLAGKPLSTLIALRDRPALEQALRAQTTPRIAPMRLRLANEEETPCVLSGLGQDGPNPRIFVTIGRLPADPPRPAPILRHDKDFAREAETRLRSGQAGALGMVNVESWGATIGKLDEAHIRDLKDEIGHLLTERAGSDAVAADVGDGKFGVLCAPDSEIGGLDDALSQVLAKYAPSQRAKISESLVSLDSGALPPKDAVLALRLMLSRFIETGQGVETPEAGLSGIIEQARAQQHDIADAIENARFKLYFQPVVSLADRSLHHYEALLRLPPGRDSLDLTTQEFVVTAELLGLAVKLDRAVFRMAADALRGCSDRIAVNLSGLSIIDPDMPDFLVRIAARAETGRLLVDLADIAAIPDIEAASAAMTRLRAAGIDICLDDVGAGNAALRHLRHLPVDFIKIDGAYVRGAMRDKQAGAVLSAMRDQAAACGAKTIAQLIETEAEFDFLHEMGIEYGQGMLFGRPAALPQMAMPLRRWRY
jgi:EAL domain-containing protein (putative c-di-GMP-specific phosphodiesterase class I)/PAS domain-containing protein